MKLDQLSTDFLPAEFGVWAYPTQQGETLPYAKGVSYSTEGFSLAELAARNHDEARATGITETLLSVTKDGMYVGLIYWMGGQNDPVRARFESSVPLADALSGEQPPITGFYPRVVFPARGSFRYAPMFLFEEGIFGTMHESHVVSVPDGTMNVDIPISNDVPCPNGVMAALREFNGSDFFVPQGDYQLSLEIERLPLLAVRIDGYRPLVAKLAYDGQVQHELPIMTMDFSDLQIFKTGASRRSSRKNPLARRVQKEKYIEMPFVLPPEENKFFFLDKAELEYQGQADRADLTYMTLRRDESVAGVVENPYLGLVEIQVSRVVRLTNCTIAFTPRCIDAEPSETLLYHTNSHPSSEKLSYEKSRSLAMPAASVSVGRTVLSNPKTGAVSSNVEAEWDTHLHTFRFCLTNATD